MLDNSQRSEELSVFRHSIATSTVGEDEGDSKACAQISLQTRRSKVLPKFHRSALPAELQGQFSG